MQSAQSDLFGTVPSAYLPIWDEPGRVNAQQLAKFLDFTKQDVEGAARIAPRTFAYGQPLPKVVEDRLLEWAVVLELVAGYFKGDVEKTLLWFKVPNPLLGDMPPREMIRIGRARKLARIISDALQGITP